MMSKFNEMANRIMKQGIISEEKKSMKDQIIEILKDAEEISETRREIIADILSEYDLPKEELEKITKKFMTLLGDAKFAEKFAEVSKVMTEIDKDLASELLALREKVQKFVENPNIGTKSAIKNGLVKAFANTEDAELKKLVKAERALIDMVRSAK